MPVHDTDNNRKIKVHLLHKLPTPYNDAFFRAIHDDSRVELRVHHLWRQSALRPWKTELGNGYSNRYMDMKLGIDWYLLRLALREKTSVFIVADWGHFASLCLIVARIVVGAPICIWTDTPQENSPRPRIKRLLRRKLLKWLLPKVDVVFGTGRPALRVLANYGVSPEKLVNLPCFVDVDEPKRSESDPELHKLREDIRNNLGCGTDGVVFTMVGYLTDFKGQDIGIEAFASCLEQVQRPIGLLIVGDGPTRAELQNLVSQRKLQRAVTFMGWQEPEQMKAIYAAADVVVHPSRRDAYPLVVLEAMSWGKAVIGSDVCGSVQDRICHGANGFIFPVNDQQSLASIMIELACNSTYLHSVQAAARDASQEFGVRNGVETVVKVAQFLTASERA